MPESLGDGDGDGEQEPAPGPEPEVALVDLAGEIVGTSGKLAAHQPPGVLHLAFSVLLFRPDGRMLLQRRAPGKYHFPGVWANACCSHPRPGEAVPEAAARRLAEELGVSCALEEVGTFVYRAVCPTSGLVEHELDHVLVGTLEAGEEPRPDPLEVDAWCWVDPGSLLARPPQGTAAPAGTAAPGPLAPWLPPALLLARRSLAKLGPGPR